MQCAAINHLPSFFTILIFLLYYNTQYDEGENSSCNMRNNDVLLCSFLSLFMLYPYSICQWLWIDDEKGYWDVVCSRRRIKWWKKLHGNLHWSKHHLLAIKWALDSFQCAVDENKITWDEKHTRKWKKSSRKILWRC